MISSVLLGTYSRRCSWAKRTSVPQLFLLWGHFWCSPLLHTVLAAKRSLREHSAQEAGLGSARREDLCGVAI